MKDRTKEISVDEMRKLLTGQDPRLNERRSEKPVDVHPEKHAEPQPKPTLVGELKKLFDKSEKT